MNEYDLIMKTVSEKMDKDSMVILGIIKNESFKDQEKIRVTIIATGFSLKDEQVIEKEITGEVNIVEDKEEEIEKLRDNNKTEIKVANGTTERIIAFDTYEALKRQIFGENVEIPAFLKQKKFSEKND